MDDDEDEFLIFEAALEQVDPNFEVFYLDSFFEKPANAECAIPDIMFLDLNMPKNNGFDWLKKIRDVGYTFPIIMYSTTRNELKIEQAYKLGANLFLTKPNSFIELAKALDLLFQIDWEKPEEVRENFFTHGKYHFSIND